MEFRNLIIKVSYGILVMGVILFIIKLFSFSKTDEIDNKYQDTINNNYVVYAPIIPSDVDFAGEKIPVDNYDVRESLDMELMKTMYWHSEALLYIKRANRYFPIIEPILAKNGVPDDFKYLAVAESGLKNVVSPAGAAGYWQFLKATGIEYKLEITTEIDQRYDIEKSTQAACEYLLNAYKKYKNWTLVAASYNMGGGALNKEIETQKVDNYYDLLLNSETGRYVYRIVAYKLIMKNPRNYGFVFRDKDLYPTIKTKTLEIDSTISNLIDFAKANNTNYKVFKDLNQWLRSKTLTNTTKKKYYIRVPIENSRNFDYFKKIMPPTPVEIKPEIKTDSV